MGNENLIPMGAELQLLGLQTFLRGMEDAGKGTERTRKKMSKLRRGVAAGFKTAGGIIGRVGSAVSDVAVGMVKAGVVATGVGVLAVREFGKFEKSMARVGTLLDDGVSGMEQFGQSTLQTATRFGQFVGTVSEATFQAISAGIDSSKESVESFTDLVGRAAVGGVTDMTTVVDGLTTTMNSYGIAVEDAESVSDDFFTTNKLGKTTFEELSKSIGRAAPGARALGVSYQELLAATVSLTKGGVKTSEVMSNLKQLFANISNPTDKAKKAADDVGVAFNIAGLQGLGFAGFLNNLANKTRGNTEAQVALFGSVEAFNAISRLSSREGLRDFNESLREMQNNAGATEKAFARVANTIGFKLDQIKVAGQRFLIEGGAGLVEGLGLDRVPDLSKMIDETAVKVREGARIFAEGFTEAFAPLREAAGFDWKGFAKDLGSAAGEIASAFKDAVEDMKLMLDTARDIMGFVREVVAALRGAGSPVQRAARKAGGVAVEEFRTTTPSKNILGFVNGVDVRDSFRVTSPLGVQTFDTRAEADAAASAARGRLSLAHDAVRTSEALQAKGEGIARIHKQLSGAVAGVQASIGGALRDRLSAAQQAWELTINQKNIVNGEEDKPDKPFRGRGRGSAQIETSAETMFLIFEDRIERVSDSFAFAHLLTAETA